MRISDARDTQIFIGSRVNANNKGPFPHGAIRGIKGLGPKLPG